LRGHECQILNNWTYTDADVYWFDFCDNNLIVATRDDKEHLKTKKVIARLHAVEAYMGFYKQIDWGCVNHLIFVSDHIRRKCLDAQYPDSCKIHVIHNGVDMERFRFRERMRDSTKYLGSWNFGYVGNIVPQKGLLNFLHYFSFIRKEVPDAKFYLAGLNRMHGREGEYWEYMKERIGNIFEETEGIDTNEWLEDKDINYLVQPSYAESFSLIVAEAMAKGIKPLVNDYWGSRELWPEDLIYTNVAEFSTIIEAPYESKRYREWVEKRYNLEDKINQLEELITK
jgi:glycosyltransferase involved in cell wall biosynthesis